MYIMLNYDTIPLPGLLADELFILEKLEAQELLYTRTQRQEYYEFIWFTEVAENEYHVIDFEKHLLRRNEVFILTPNQVHTFDVGTNKGYKIPMSAEFLESLFGIEIELMCHPYFWKVKISDELADTLHEIMGLIEKEYNARRRRELLITYMKAFFLHLKHARRSLGSFNKVANEVKYILQLITLQYKSQKEVSYYAKAVHLNPRRINDMMIHATNLTVKQHIINRLLIETKRKLAERKGSLKEVSFELGFNDPAYFTRFFKQKTGLTPERFRMWNHTPV